LLNPTVEGQPAHEEELGMATRDKVLPARKQRDRSRDDESLLNRSAKTLGRTIGSLQRQLDGATRRLSETAADVVGNLPDLPLVGGADSRRRARKKSKKKATKTAARKRTARKSASSTRKAGQSRTQAAKRSSKKR
jgi:hypothetical protein